MAIRKSTAEKALADLLEQRRRLDDLEGQLHVARQRVAELDATPGEAFLDDPEAGDRVVADLRVARDRLTVLTKAQAAQEQRAKAAERPYLLAEADELDKIAESARQALRAHRARTDELLAALRDHDGTYVHVSQVEELRWDLTRGTMGAAGAGVAHSFEAPRSTALEDAVARAEVPVRILRDLADGREPQVPVGPGESLGDYYPGCVWGPNAVVPAPAYLREVEAARARVAVIEQEPARYADLVARDEQRQAETSGGVRIAGVGNARKRMESQPERLEQARRELASLTSSPATVDA